MKNLILFVLVFFPVFLIQSQTEELSCGTSNPEESEDWSQLGGKYLTSSGELKVLVVFAKFKDDNNTHPYWPADSYPGEMNNYIDPSMQIGSTHFMNLTNYYNQMSFGNFKITGKATGAETPYPMSHYIPSGRTYPDRSLANSDILQVIDDSIDYREYDNWTYLSDYNHSNEPDGIVDMVVVIWRGLVLIDKWYGEASLGGGTPVWVEDNQVKIKMGFGCASGRGCYGSGVNVQYWGERIPERNFKNVIHEIAHWLIHAYHPYKKINYTFWGMLTLGGEGICANTFERERLAWINPISIEDNILSAPMDDYITTPSAYKYNLSNDNEGETYYFENHQQISIYDNGILNPDDKGIFILHCQRGDYNGDCVRLLTSDGFWNWESPKTESCWGNEIPALKKVEVNRGGTGNRDKIFINDTLSTFLYAYIDDDNSVECNGWLHGYGFNNAFDTKFNDVFSNWSNPPAKTWNRQSTDFIMEVISKSGIIVTASFRIQNSIDGKPSKPPLSWDPNKLESDYNECGINLVWGADFWDGDPIEPDVNWSELQQKVGSGSWSTIYSGPDRYWSTAKVDYDQSESGLVYFRVRVRDTQNKWSIWSELLDMKKMISNIVGNNTNEIPSNFILYQNYPNPFNPSTRIRYSIPQSSTVVIKVFDILGNEVSTLVNEEKPGDSYEVDFNAKGLSSGIYFYQLKAGSFVETKKVLLLK